MIKSVKNAKNAYKMICDQRMDGPMDEPMDQQTDGPTDWQTKKWLIELRDTQLKIGFAAHLLKKIASGYNKNKARYTATKVACGWAGAVIKKTEQER